MPYDSANPHPGVHPTGTCTYVHKKTGTRMFIIAIFIITKNWKQPKDPSTGEWRNKLRYVSVDT